MTGQIDVAALGEPLGVLYPDPAGGGASRCYTLGCGGAEMNALIGLARLGHRTEFITAVGNDALGEQVLDVLRGEGIGIDGVRVVPDHPTGLYVKQPRVGSRRDVVYYRDGSAAAHVSASVVDRVVALRPRLVLVSGLTLGLGGVDGLGSAVRRMLDHKVDGGYLVAFDANVRNGIWDGPRAVREFAEILGHIDILIAGDDELRLLGAGLPPLDAALVAIAAGVRCVYLKRGAAGSVVVEPDGHHVVPAVAVARVVDRIGAGDAYTAGVVSGVLRGWTSVRGARLGTVLGAHAVTQAGDWEGFPSPTDMTEIVTVIGGGRDFEPVLEDVPDPVKAFYRACLDGDSETMAACLHHDAVVRFPGRPVITGRAAAAEFFEFCAGLFTVLDFRIVEALSDGAGSAVVWQEAGVTRGGDPWVAHGVDVYTVTDGLIADIEVVSDPRPVRALLPKYEGRVS